MFKKITVPLTCWFTRAFDQFPGRWRIVRWLNTQESVFVALAPATVRIGGTYRMHVNPADFDGRPIYILGFDPQDWIGCCFGSFLKAGDNVLDIGGNIGYFTLLAAKLVGASGSVHTFEASPSVFKTLERNAQLNPTADITLYNKAISDECGLIEFYTATEEHTGLSSMRNLGEATGTVEKIHAITIDSILAKLPKISLVKIDVEGAEQLVIGGMKSLIERDKPIIILELTDTFLQELGSSANSLCESLRKMDLKLYRIGRRGKLIPLDEAPPEQCNIVACYSSLTLPASIEIESSS